MTPENRALLETFLQQDGRTGNPGSALDAFDVYLGELLRWNEFINLTAIANEPDIVVKHFLDSLLPLRFIRDDDFILDIGSGAGFPGLPIKIVLSPVRLVMLDARLKKINFLNAVIGLLKLRGATALHQRAEARDFQELMGKSFDVVISRASFPLDRLAALALPYMKESGKLIAMKSHKEEATDNLPGLRQRDEFVTHLPDGSFRRVLVFGRA